MAEVLIDFPALTLGPDGTAYRAQACGAATEDGSWHGWIEYAPVEGGTVLRTPRETTQPNRESALYWASGLTGVYLKGALQRALARPLSRPSSIQNRPSYDGPAPDFDTERPVGPPRASVLDPFSVYTKGEQLLRKQLAALSTWHLVNIIRAHELADESDAALNALSVRTLVELIVSAVRRRVESVETS